MKLKKLSVLMVLPFALSACGGKGDSASGGGNGGGLGESISAQFIDAPVKGLNVAGSVSATGKTGTNGMFACKRGEEVEFRVHDKLIGKTTCNEKIFIHDLQGEDYLGAAALIQSLSKTVSGDLDLSAFNAAPQTLASIDLTDIDSEITAKLSATLTALGLTQVNLADATTHADSNLPDLSNDVVLGAIAASGVQIVNLIGASSNEADYCWKNVQVKLELKEVANAYRFKVNEYLAYDSASAPVSPTCDGNENDDYQCIANPVSKIMTGRSASGSSYESDRFDIAAGENVACYSTSKSEYYVTDQTIEGVCESGDTPIKAEKNQILKLDFGWTFGISVSETGYSINFKEGAVDVEPTFTNSSSPDDAKVSFAVRNFNCNYSASGSLE